MVRRAWKVALATVRPMDGGEVLRKDGGDVGLAAWSNKVPLWFHRHREHCYSFQTSGADPEGWRRDIR